MFSHYANARKNDIAHLGIMSKTESFELALRSEIIETTRRSAKTALVVRLKRLEEKFLCCFENDGDIREKFWQRVSFFWERYVGETEKFW